MILVTGAGGKTGLAILRQLKLRHAAARAFVHRPADEDAALQAGAAEAAVGDFEVEADLNAALRGVDTVYHICPNMHPNEVGIGQALISAAGRAGIGRFVFHSVLHPQTRGMSHHWNKLQVEELLFESGLPFTILQPCAYMQNILGYWKVLVEEGIYSVPYSMETRISVVDLEDVAEAAARVLTTDGHLNAAYELAGPELVSQAEIADLLSSALQRDVRAQQIDIGDWEKRARAAGMTEYAITTLVAMFTYYQRFGFVGNSNVLAWLLGRPAHTFTDFILNTTVGG